MKLSPDEFEEKIAAARDYLQGSRGAEVFNRDFATIARDFAETLVQVADTCVVGVRCERHGGAVHGQEAEELRAGVEQILRNTADVRDDAVPDVLRALRKSLILLLDRTDARDSLAFREVTDVDADVDGVDEVPPIWSPSTETAGRT